jgi:hypothetical protein
MYYVWCVMTGFYVMSCVCIYVFWHVLHPLVLFSQKDLQNKVNMNMNTEDWWIGKDLKGSKPRPTQDTIPAFASKDW